QYCSSFSSQVLTVPPRSGRAAKPSCVCLRSFVFFILNIFKVSISESASIETVKVRIPHKSDTMKIQTSGGDQIEVDRSSNSWAMVQQICQQVGQENAFYVCNLSSILEKHKGWQAVMPRVEPHYAVKCNNDLAVLEILATLGACFDCASRAEIRKVLSLGVSPDRIIFANPAKISSHIRYAADVGVATMTFDDVCELHKIQNLYPSARLVIRIRVDATDAQCPLGMKFGCEPNDAPQLLDVARSLNLNVVGVSFHVGSGCREPAVFRRAISAARDVFDYASTVGFKFSLLDIGGGYPGVRGSSLTDIAAVVNNALEDFFRDMDVRVIAEPGRYYVTSAFTLACNIHSVRKITDVDDQGRRFETHRMYYINDGVYGSFNCVLYDHQVVCPVPLKEYPESRRISSSVWGPTCDGLDRVIEDISLPDMNIGDWMVFEDMGAYTLPVASTFNGFPVPEVCYIIKQHEWAQLKNFISLSRAELEVIEEPNAADEELFCLKIPSNLNAPLASVKKPEAFATICSSDLMVG
ncbi:hypothetical protein D910_07278, partial [Dendroctonus ponderosae]